jgi:hypothetical protein
MLPRNPQLPESLALENLQAVRRKSAGAIGFRGARGKLALSELSGAGDPVLLLTCQREKSIDHARLLGYLFGGERLITCNLASIFSPRAAKTSRQRKSALAASRCGRRLLGGDMYC